MDNNNLIDDLIDAAEELSTRQSWGSGVKKATVELAAAREAVVAEMTRLQLHIATLERIIEREIARGQPDDLPSEDR